MEEQAGENYATAKADAERGIAKIKADALRVAAIGVTTQVNNAEAAEADKARDPALTTTGPGTECARPRSGCTAAPT